MHQKSALRQSALILDFNLPLFDEFKRDMRHPKRDPDLKGILERTSSNPYLDVFASD